ncbi:MAG: glycosyltransferase [Saprospiraceae bacterium]|nr:glycosyltransferase [Saprospiraceae bacterium]
MKKNILIIGPAHPLRGGLATFNERLARAFQSEGHTVNIVTFSLQYPDFLFPGKTQYSTEPAPTDLNISVAINAFNPFNWLKMGRILARQHADLVICRFWLPIMSPCLGTILRFISRNKRSKIIGLIDNIVPHEKHFGDRPLAQYFVSACAAFVVMSRSVEAEMKTFTNRPVAYIPHPIYDTYGEKSDRSTALNKLQLDRNQRYILFFGFIRHYKGLDLLLDALATEGVKKFGIKLIVAGEFYEDETLYRDKIKDLGIENQVILHADFIPTDAVRYYFAAADLVVQPYRTATQSGISQVAYHFEKPMIVTNVGGLPEIVPHGKAGYVVEPTPLSIAVALVDFYEKKQLDAFEEGVVAQKKRFSWEAMTQAFLYSV